MSEYTGWPKAVVGTIARNKTNRPGKLRLRASTFSGYQSTRAGGGDRKSSSHRVRSR